VRRRGWSYPSAQWVKEVQRLAELDKRLPAFVQGRQKPGNTGDCLALAELCRIKRRYAGSARFFTDAFARQPKIATELSAGHRYNAACSAALAGSGWGEDAEQLNNKEKGRLRGQASGWLRADLSLWKQRLTGGKAPERQAAQQALRHWQTDPDLAGVRDKTELTKLPDAERQEWAKLWTEVAALSAKAGSKK
jgi:serine/threonine-protein kinase